MVSSIRASELVVSLASLSKPRADDNKVMFFGLVLGLFAAAFFNERMPTPRLELEISALKLMSKLLGEKAMFFLYVYTWRSPLTLQGGKEGSTSYYRWLCKYHVFDCR